MGYTTSFEGEFKVNKPVDEKTYDLLVGLATTRRMKRSGLDPKIYGVEGEFYCEDRRDSGQQNKPSKGKIVDSNEPPSTQPSLWCQWLIQEDSQTIKWDEGEKFYHYVEWIKYLIDKILKPRGYIVDGEVHWRGEEFRDIGTIVVKDNKVKTVPYGTQI